MAVVLKWFGKECEKQILSATEQAVLKGCHMIESDTKTSMVAGTGREYKRGKKIHRASVAGQPPAVDTGRLRASIAVNWTNSGLPNGKVINPKQSGDGISMPPSENGKFTGRVGTNVEYACLKAMTDVLTNKGWKRISLIKVGDLVLTQTGEYHKVLERIKIKNTERPDMVTIEVNWRKYFIRKLMMTKEHKILIYREGRNKWVQAKDLLNTDQVFCTPKISSNKGISIYKDVLCKNCGNIVPKKKNRIFCSVKCRTDYWKKTGTNPHIGMKRSELTKKKISLITINRLKERPKSHVNCIVSKKGFQTEPERKTLEWLKSRNIDKEIIRQYYIAGHYVDFYIPSLNKIYEADGSYWHKDQEKDIKRDKDILKEIPNVEIHHLHFYDERHSPKDINQNPLPNVYYSVCNPDVNSYVNLSTFKPFNIKKITNWEYKVEPKGKQKGIRTAYLYDLSIEGVHSYYANGVLVSNSHLEFGTVKMGPRPFLRPAFEKNISKIRNLFNNLIK